MHSCRGYIVPICPVRPASRCVPRVGHRMKPSIKRAPPARSYGTRHSPDHQKDTYKDFISSMCKQWDANRECTMGDWRYKEVSPREIVGKYVGNGWEIRDHSDDGMAIPSRVATPVFPVVKINLDDKGNIEFPICFPKSYDGPVPASDDSVLRHGKSRGSIDITNKEEVVALVQETLKSAAVPDVKTLTEERITRIVKEVFKANKVDAPPKTTPGSVMSTMLWFTLTALGMVGVILALYLLFYLLSYIFLALFVAFEIIKELSDD